MKASSERKKRLVGRFAPRMSELIAFEAAARYGSFTRAALELHLTQGTVSRSVDMLEQRMRTRHIVLPDTGAKPVAVQFADWLTSIAQ